MSKTAAKLVYDVRSYRDEDEPRVLELLGASLGGGPAGARPPEFFRWKHLANPFGPSYLLLAEHDGRIIGLRAFMRWEFRAGGRTVRAVRAVDTATHPDYQGQGVFRRLTLEALEALRDEADLVFNTPNHQSLPGYLKMGWRTVGRVPVAIRVRRPWRFARGLRAMDATGPPRDGPPIEAAMACEALRDAGGLHLSSHGSVGRLATPRTLDYLLWRYADAPLLGYRAVRDEDGLAIFRVRPRGRLWEATVAEVLAADRGAASRLLGRVAKAARVDHVACSFPTGWPQRGALRRRGFVPAPGGITLVANPLSEDLGMDPLDLSSWALTLGDVEVF